MGVLGHWSDDAVRGIYRRLDGGRFGRTSNDQIRAVLHAAEAVPVGELQGAVEALRKYGGCLEDCNALSGAPECSCGFDEAMLRALGGGQ